MVAQRDWLNQEEDTRCLLVEGDAMTPMVADGAFVAYMDRVEPLESLDHQLVVARVEGELIVRWLQLSGRYAILRAENPEAESATKLLELPSRLEEHPIRRVLWISTPH
jgi:SOS-response transcriptional repressor LexA